MNRLRSWWTLVLLLLFVLSAGAAFHAASHRLIRIADVALAMDTDGENGRELSLTGSEAAEDAADITLPLPQDVHFEHVSFENRYMTGEFLVRLQTGMPSFYETVPVPCNTDRVTSVHTVYTGESRTLDLIFRLAGVYEADVLVEDAQLQIRLHPPEELFRRVVVLDPAFREPDDLSLRLALAVRDRAASADDGLRVYLTRTDVLAASEASCLRLADEVKADRFLRLEASGDGSLSASACFYDGFFLRGYGSAEFATDVERHLSHVAGVHAVGVGALRNAFALPSLKIPAAMLSLNGLDGSASQIDAIADAVYAGLVSDLTE